ncbi:MAG TPA: hypothetical protein VIL31_01620 [Cyclobacteriaceae bacterium]|jgi:hypothetical protein
MDEKINLRAIERYSEEFSEKLIGNWFASRDSITGKEILQFSEIKQINLFVIYELFRTWKQESIKNRSPYFDYDAPEVREATAAMMNTLSNHIRVDRVNFTPLLRKATYNTLLLIVDPYDFFADLIEKHTELVPSEFADHLKYVRINKAPLQRLLEKLQERQVNSISGNEAFALLDSILEEVNFTPEDIDEYLAAFSRVVPVSIDSFYEKKEEPKPRIDPEPANHYQWQPVKSTVNDKLSQEPRPLVADQFMRITSIKESLTINQKFMFTKVLFHGDFELFSRAIEDLDRQDHLQGALRYLERNYQEWDRESEEFHEFMELLEKRFGPQ